jgi:hypothetical protein
MLLDEVQQVLLRFEGGCAVARRLATFIEVRVVRVVVLFREAQPLGKPLALAPRG